jgi:hypothetical protein
MSAVLEVAARPIALFGLVLLGNIANVFAPRRGHTYLGRVVGFRVAREVRFVMRFRSSHYVAIGKSDSPTLTLVSTKISSSSSRRPEVTTTDSSEWGCF